MIIWEVHFWPYSFMVSVVMDTLVRLVARWQLNCACELVSGNPGDGGAASPQRHRAWLFSFPPPCLRLWQQMEPLELTLLGCASADTEAATVRGLKTSVSIQMQDKVTDLVQGLFSPTPDLLVAQRQFGIPCGHVGPCWLPHVGSKPFSILTLVVWRTHICNSDRFSHHIWVPWIMWRR